MLAEATALLLASLTVVSVTGAPVAPASSRPPISATAGITAAGPGAGIPTAHQPYGSPLLGRLVATGSSRSTGTAATALNATVSGAVDRATHRDAVRSMLVDPPAPRTVANWWGSLDGGKQLRSAIAAPELVGNLDGVPYAMRDQANRAVLRETISDLELGLAAGTSRALQT
ncbi:MAG: hypothetical protein LH471_09075, partial [Salinibacterium sp.]|nr:hypothetical protein [Salinibacterium sp.]